MNNETCPARIVILAFPETTASVVYGMYDLFKSAGRDWGVIVSGQPGCELIAPVVVSRQASGFTASNGVRITPQAALDECLNADVVCVPELTVPPGAPLDGLFDEEIAWLQRCHTRGPDSITIYSPRHIRLNSKYGITIDILNRYWSPHGFRQSEYAHRYCH